MAGALLGPVETAAKRQWAEAGIDPWTWMGKNLLRVGLGLVVTGFAMGTVGYFTKASATAAMNTETATLQNMAAIFSNIVQPTFTPAPTGTAPVSASLQGIQNFAHDAWTDITAAGSDVAQAGAAIGTLAEDVGIALTDVAKVMLAGVMHGPQLVWNGLVWGIGGSIADVLDWLFPWFIIVGAIMVVLGTVILGAKKAWGSIAQPAWERSAGKWSERQEARLERGFDRLFGNFKTTETVPVAPTPTLAVASPASPPNMTAGPETVKQAEGGGEPGASSGAWPPFAPAITEPPPEPAEPPVPAQTSVETPPLNVPSLPSEPAPAIMTRSEVEAYLGDRPNRAPTQDELRKMVDEAEARRQESMPRKKKGVSGYDESLKAADAFAAAESGA